MLATLTTLLGQYGGGNGSGGGGGGYGAGYWIVVAIIAIVVVAVAVWLIRRFAMRGRTNRTTGTTRPDTTRNDRAA